MTTTRKVRSEPAAPYTVTGDALVMAALDHLSARFADRTVTFEQPSVVGAYCALQIGNADAEQFCVAFLDNRHRLISWETMFTGTLDGCSVYPREVARRALQHNAAAVVFAHNHPSGVPDPSQADRDITRTLRQALALFEIRTLDHMVVAGGSWCSLAERGWL